MAWLVLVVAGALEAVWAVALGKSRGLHPARPQRACSSPPSTASMAGLAYAMRTLPIGTAYAVWVGIGAALTVAFGMATGDEPSAGQDAPHHRPHRLRHRPQVRALSAPHPIAPTHERLAGQSRGSCGPGNPTSLNSRLGWA